jgi:hypothetical protein
VIVFERIGCAIEFVLVGRTFGYLDNGIYLMGGVIADRDPFKSWHYLVCLPNSLCVEQMILATIMPNFKTR